MAGSGSTARSPSDAIPIDESIEEILDQAFDQILDVMARTCLKNSSSIFFVMYAHDNDQLPDYPAGAAIVERFINWFKKLFLDVDSDRSPHWWGLSWGAEVGGVSNDILISQMCLLPAQWGIQHVDWALVFGSELLGKYIQDEQDCPSEAGKTYTQPFGHYTKSLPNFIVSDKTLLRIEADRHDLYETFFRILLQFEAIEGDRHLIEAFKDCFKECKKALLNSRDSQERTRLYCWAIILKTLQALYSSAAYQKLERHITVPEIRRLLNVHYLLDQSDIRRVSGDLFPQNSKDIDLVVSGQQSRTVVAIHELFKPRKSRTDNEHGPMLNPKRILIQDTPRETRLGDPPADLQQLLFDEFFKLQLKGRQFAEKLKDLILDLISCSKILLILDGLGEMRTSGTDKNNLFSKLVNQEIAVITSRPSASQMLAIENIDLQLDAIGLSMDSIWDYLNNREIIRSEATAATIRQAIMNGYISLEMARVPIRLDMLCYSWDELERQREVTSPHTDGEGWAEPPTVTEIYRTITQKLWKKDIPSLGKWDSGRPVDEYVIRSIRNPRRLERVVHAEVRLRGKLAVMLSARGHVQFTDADVDTAIEELESTCGPLPLNLESNLSRLSFLHQESHNSYQPSYSFIHLTFQEFFTAHYLVQDPAVLEEQIRTHKYSRHYEFIWQFVAGLLPSEHTGIDYFFDLLEREPQDLVGVRQSRLLACCFSEGGTRLSQPRQSHIRSRLLDVFRFEQRPEWQYRGPLFNYMPFSEAILQPDPDQPWSTIWRIIEFALGMRAPERFSWRFQLSVLEYIESLGIEANTFIPFFYCSALAPQTYQRLLGYWQSDKDGTLRRFALAVLTTNTHLLPETVVDMILVNFESELAAGDRGEERARTLQSLGSKMTLQCQALVAQLLSHKNKHVRFSAARLLSKQSALHEDSFENVQWHYDPPRSSLSSVLLPEYLPQLDTPNSWTYLDPTARVDAQLDAVEESQNSHSCARESYGILKDLICPAPDLHAPDANSVTVTAPLDRVLQFNKKAIDRLSGLLQCPSSKPGHRVLVHAAIISRILIWYQQAAGWTSSIAPLTASVAVGQLDASTDIVPSHLSSSSPDIAANLLSLPQTTGFVVSDVPATLGKFSINDQKMQATIRSHLVLGELSNVSSLIELFGSSGVAGLNTSLAAWLRSEYDRTISALKTGLNEDVEST
ncbi:hypothetical protein MFIFM68171_08120 [Madurella fahalii]|uniref:Aflatoxin regulatory protein domain-containing protein n=1 Tax=Madurella fahalii TaxID=1157608 RepID=A0ABQ0GK29_9PEZI